MNLSQDFSEFIALLNNHEVNYLVVGGYAVILHGHPRYTGDMDFFVKQSDKNAAKIIEVLDHFGFGSLNITSEAFNQPDQILQLGRPPLRIDIMTSLSGVTFDECYSGKATFEIDDLTIPVIGLNELKKNKKASGRHNDLDDLEHL